MIMHKGLFAFKYKLSLLLVAMVVIIASILGTWQFLLMKNILERNFEQHKKLVRDRIITHVGDTDRIYLLIEEPLEAESRTILQAVRQKYEEAGTLDFDLNPLLAGKENFDLYILDDKNVIVDSTDQEEIGLDFTPWSDFVATLDHIRETKEYYSDRMDVSLLTSEMKKYGYLSSDDSKYIFEVGISLEHYTNVLRGTGFDKIEEIAGDYDFVDRVTMYNYEGVGYKRNADGTAINVTPAHKSAFDEAIKTMETVEISGEYEGKSVTYQYVPYHIMDAAGYNQNNVVEIVYNNQELQIGLNKNIISIIIVVTLGSLVAVLFGFYNARNISKPIEKFTAATKQLSEGNFNIQTKVISNDEFEILSMYFDNMASGIRNLLEERDRYEESLKVKNKEIYTQKEEITSLYEETTAMNEELETLLSENESSYFATVRALANAVEAKDTYTGGHCERVMEYSVAIAEEMALSSQDIRDLRFGSILHDIGKIGIPEEVLNKQDKYTQQDYEIMQKHPAIGHEILKHVHFLERGRKIVLEHHERMDGKGYPQGLSSEQIDLLSKIVCVADAYDAMTSSRPYRQKPFTTKEAIEEMIKNKGTQFDAQIVDVFVNWLSKNK